MRLDHRQQGMTLFEILIVLAVMALVMTLGFFTVRAMSKTLLRGDTVEVAAALRAAHNLATQSGMHHRVVFDLDAQTYRIEVCPDPIQLARGGEEEERPDVEALQRLAEQPNPLAAGPGGLASMGGMGGMAGAGIGAALGDIAGAESPEAALKASAALAGVRVGTARCGIAPAIGGDLRRDRVQQPNVHDLSKGDGISIRRMQVQHIKGEVQKGEVSVNFFPLGYAEKAFIEMADKDGDEFTVLVHGLTARIEVVGGSVDPDKHMRRNAAGDEVDEP